MTENKKNAYWYGSQLSVQEARKLAPYNNATSLQVAAGVLGAVVWAMENPERGIVEPDELETRSRKLGERYMTAELKFAIPVASETEVATEPADFGDGEFIVVSRRGKRHTKRAQQALGQPAQAAQPTTEAGA